MAIEPFYNITALRWKDASKEKPDNRRCVLVWIAPDAPCVAFWDDKRQCWDDGDYYDNIPGVTHWADIIGPNGEKQGP